jgi:hypothetical protein
VAFFTATELPSAIFSTIIGYEPELGLYGYEKRDPDEWNLTDYDKEMLTGMKIQL